VYAGRGHARPLADRSGSSSSNASVVQLASQKRLKDVLELPSEKSDHPDAGPGQCFLKRQGDGPAQQHVHPQSDQFLHALGSFTAGKPQALALNFPAVFDIEQQ